MRIAIGSDHGGFSLKGVIADYIKTLGHEVIDVGTYSSDAVDYPDYAFKVGQKVQTGEAELGVMIDGAGIGSSMALNKMSGILAAVCNEYYVTRNSKLHNNANVMTMGSMVVGPGLAKELVKTFIEYEYEGGRHQTRVDKVHNCLQGGSGGSLDYNTIKAMVQEIVSRIAGSLLAVAPSSPVPAPEKTQGKIKSTGKLLNEEDVRHAAKNMGKITISRGTIITPLAKDTARDLKVEIIVVD